MSGELKVNNQTNLASEKITSTPVKGAMRGRHINQIDGYEKLAKRERLKQDLVTVAALIACLAGTILFITCPLALTGIPMIIGTVIGVGLIFSTISALFLLTHYENKAYKFEKIYLTREKFKKFAQEELKRSEFADIDIAYKWFEWHNNLHSIKNTIQQDIEKFKQSHQQLKQLRKLNNKQRDLERDLENFNIYKQRDVNVKPISNANSIYETPYHYSNDYDIRKKRIVI